MRLISLTQGQFAIVDDGNYEWLSQWNWCAAWRLGTKSFYAERRDNIKKGRHTISMAREILGLTYGDGRYSDHINHITLDNRILNLRIVTAQQNSWNRKNPKGYSWKKANKKYEASIRLNDKLIYLGLFHTAKEAYSAYLEAKKHYHNIQTQEK